MMEVRKSSFGSTSRNSNSGLPAYEQSSVNTPVYTSGYIIDNIVNFLTRHQDGKYTSSDPTCFHIPQKSYEDLQQYLHEHRDLGEYVDNKVRYLQSLHELKKIRTKGSYRFEYVVQPSILTFFPMASILHDKFLDDFRTDFQAQVKSQEPRLSGFGSAKIKLLNGDIRSPDHWLGDNTNKLPAVVIEVVYSRRQKNLDEKMKSYIQHSQGHIRLGVAVELEYPKPTAVKVTSYRPDFIDAENFLCRKGQPVVRAPQDLYNYAEIAKVYHTKRCIQQ